jgi:hypothetical protein
MSGSLPVPAATIVGGHAQIASEDEYVVATHLEGNFPGGVVDLEQRFAVSGDLISDLLI